MTPDKQTRDRDRKRIERQRERRKDRHADKQQLDYVAKHYEQEDEADE